MMEEQKQIEPIALDGEVVTDTPLVITPDDLARVDEFMDRLHDLLARLGIPPTGTIIESNLEPVNEATKWPMPYGITGGMHHE